MLLPALATQKSLAPLPIAIPYGLIRLGSTNSAAPLWSLTKLICS